VSFRWIAIPEVADGVTDCSVLEDGTGEPLAEGSADALDDGTGELLAEGTGELLEDGTEE
jgi:hypothetical protein